MITISFIKDYLKHRLTAKNRHGLHSPFVYRLLDEVIYDFRATPVYDEIEDKKSRLLPNSRRKGNPRRVDQLLYRLVHHFNPATVIEIGTGMGISQRYLAKGAPAANLNSFEHDGALMHATAKLPVIDFAFVNYYRPGALFECFELLLPRFNAQSILVICNVYGSPVAKENWQRIKNHPDVKATVDLFWLQLVFFRDGMAKEHFRLRF